MLRRGRFWLELFVRLGLVFGFFFVIVIWKYAMKQVERLKSKTKPRKLCVMGNETAGEQTKMLQRKFPRAGRRRAS